MKEKYKFLMSDGVAASPGSWMKINNLGGARCQTIRSGKNYYPPRELKQTVLHFLKRPNEMWKWERSLYEGAWERQNP